MILFVLLVSLAARGQIDTSNYLLFLKAMNTYAMPEKALEYYLNIPEDKLTDALKIEKSVTLFNAGKIKESTNLAVSLYNKNADELNYHLAKCYAELNKAGFSVGYLQKHLSEKNKCPLNKIKSDPSFQKIENSEEWINLWREKEWYSKYDLQLEDALYELKQGNTQQAFEMLDKLTQIRKSMHMAMYHKAKVYMLKNDQDNALVAINLALDKDENNAKYLYQKSVIEYALEKYKKANKSIEKAISNDNTQIDFYIHRVKIYLELDQTEQAEADFEVIAKTVNTSKLNYLAANVYHKSGNNMKALQLINQAVKAEKYNPEYYLKRAEIYAASYAYEFAEKDYAMALDFLPTEGSIYYNRGIARIKQRKYKAGCSDFNKAYQFKYMPAAEAINRYCQNQ